MLREVRLYHQENWIVNYLAIDALLIIFLFQTSQDMTVWFGINVETVNYYFEVFVNLSLGYLVSTIFYILVVYYPDRKKQKKVSAKTSILFARMQTQLRTITSIFIESVAFDVDATTKVSDKYKEHINNIDILELMGKLKVEQPDGQSTGLEEVIRASSEIESLKNRLIPFLAYMQSKELDLYADLEEIFIFENMDKLDVFPPKQYLFTQEFPTIVKTFYDCQLVVKGRINEFVVFDKGT